MLTDTPKFHPGPRCSVGKALHTLSPEDAQQLQEWLDDADRDSLRIWRSLKASGVKVAEQQVGRHRRRYCSCFS